MYYVTHSVFFVSTVCDTIFDVFLIYFIYRSLFSKYSSSRKYFSISDNSCVAVTSLDY